MSWGPFWMYYCCYDCGVKYKSCTDTIADPSFGRCPHCDKQGVLVGESGTAVPDDELSYIDTYDG